jgi:acetyl-CoA carboxylase biotin carboxyl carrier protein
MIRSLETKGVCHLLKVQEIRELIKLIDESSIEEFEYENDGAKVLLKKRTGASTQVVTTFMPEQVQAPVVHQAPPVVQETPVSTPTAEKVANDETANLHKIVSPMVGTFYSSQSPDVEAFVKVGSKVDKESVVCIVEAMKLFNEIEADVKGEIVEVLVQNGQLVEYGQPLFLVKAV